MTGSTPTLSLDAVLAYVTLIFDSAATGPILKTHEHDPVTGEWYDIEYTTSRDGIIDESELTDTQEIRYAGTGLNLTTTT